MIYWSLALTNLEKTGAQTAQFFYESDEMKELAKQDSDFIVRLYTGLMDREPTQSEVDYWLGQMANGKTRSDLIAFFATSEEFTKLCADFGIERGDI